MTEQNPALKISDSQIIESAINEASRPSEESATDETVDVVVDNDIVDDETDAGLHPDALDIEDEEGDDPDLSEDDIKDSNRLKERFKKLTSAVKQGKDAMEREAQLLEEIARLKQSKPDLKSEVEAPKSDSEYSAEQLAQAKKLMDQLGYVPKDQMEELKNNLNKLSVAKAREEDQKSLKEALSQFTDDKGQPIVQEKHVNNALRKWLSSDDPLIRKRAEQDYPAIIQLISGNRSVKPKAKTPAPKVPAGGGAQTFKPEEPDLSYNPGDPIGSKERLISRIINSF